MAGSLPGRSRKSGPRLAALAGLPQKVREQIERQLAEQSPQAPTKYRSRSVEETVVDVPSLYDSQWEADVASDLQLQRQRGEILDWSWAPRFVLQRDPQRPRTMITYRPDFVVWPLKGPWYVIDAKGVRTQQFSLRERLWRLRFPDNPLIVLKKPSRRAT